MRATLGVPAIAAALLGWQLFTPPVVGLANNNDFPKIAGYFSLGPARAGDDFIYVVQHWVRDPRFLWDSGFRVTGHLHTALGAAVGTDIRWIGLTYAVPMLAAFAVAASFLGWRALIGIPPLLDIAYSAYFNSMFMDAGSIVWLSLALAALARTAARPAPWTRALFLAAAAAFLCSKSSHAPLGFLLALAVLAVERTKTPAVIAMTIVAVSIAQLRSIPEFYRGQAMYNLVFTKIAETEDDAGFRSAALRLGVREDELKWKHTTAFMPESPAQDQRWLDEFAGRVRHSSMARLYLERPGLALRFLWRDMRVEAPFIRPVHLGNFDRSSGREPGAKSMGVLALWSAMRSWLIARAPWHLPLLFAAAAAWIAARRMWLSMPALLFAMAAVELLLAALADACETSRHLVLFHYMTDAALVACLAGVSWNGGVVPKHP